MNGFGDLVVTTTCPPVVRVDGRADGTTTPEQRRLVRRIGDEVEVPLDHGCASSRFRRST